MDAYAVKYATNGLSLINQFLQNDGSMVELIDPFCTIFKLSLLNYKMEGTKLSIKNHHITIQDYGLYQSIQRWYNSDERNQLYQLKLPLFYFRGIVMGFIKFSFLQLDQSMLDYMNRAAIKGLKKMRQTYDLDGRNGSLVLNSIDEYIKILSTAYHPDDYQEEMAMIGKSTLIAIYNEYIKLWSQYDFKILKKLYYLTDIEESGKIKNELSNAIDHFINAKDLKIDHIRLNC